MYKVPNTPTKRDIYEFLSKSASFGNLGLFIGAGFSKAVINDGITNGALAWEELLKECAVHMEIDYDEILKEGIGYPQIATILCEMYSTNKDIDYGESLKFLKQKICDLTSLYPTRERRNEFSEYIKSFNPTWIITTNYDLVIESLLPGKSTTLSPKDQLIAASGIIPVFHLHGVRTNPEGLIITQEDYVSLFRPNEYRQIKLALTIKESTVLLFGYGLGDVNVLTALDWSKNVFDAQESNYPQDVIQILYSPTPNENPYRDKNGIIIFETDDLVTIFKEFIEVRDELVEKEKEESAELDALAVTLNESEDSEVEKFIDNAEFRKEVLKKLSEFSSHLISSFETFLDKCIQETWNRAMPRNAFGAYAENLTIILDILESFSFEKMPPALFEILAHSLDRVGWYIGDKPGESHKAWKIWNQRKTELPRKIIEELNNFSIRRNCVNLKRLLATE